MELSKEKAWLTCIDHFWLKSLDCIWLGSRESLKGVEERMPKSILGQIDLAVTCKWVGIGNRHRD